MYNSFKNNIKDNNIISRKDRVLIAFSGGKDSVVLLDLLYKFNKNIALIHIDHGIRENSHKDAIFSKECSLKYKIKYFEKKLKLKNQKSDIENIARQKRYEVFYEIAEKYNYDKIALAHSKSDNIENFFIRLYRGTSLEGLGGIKEKNKKIVRPLLIFSSQEIRNYIKDNNLKNIEDESNNENYFLRNKIRNKILPLINIENYSLIKNIEKLTKQINLENNYINGEIEQIMKQNVHVFEDLVFLKKDYFNSLHLAIRNRLINNILISVFKVKVNYQMIEKVTETFLLKNKKENISKNIIIYSSYDYIAFKTKSNSHFSIKNTEKIFSIIKNDIKYFKNCSLSDLKIDKTNFTTFKQGDSFLKYNGKKKKLKDIFIDNKIPTFLRKNWPLLKINNKIVAILLIEKGYYYSFK